MIDGNIIGPLVHLMQTAAYVVKKEAALAIANATDVGSPDQIKYASSSSCFYEVMCLQHVFQLIDFFFLLGILETRVASRRFLIYFVILKLTY